MFWKTQAYVGRKIEGRPMGSKNRKECNTLKLKKGWYAAVRSRCVVAMSSFSLISCQRLTVGLDALTDGNCKGSLIDRTSKCDREQYDHQHKMWV